MEHTYQVIINGKLRLDIRIYKWQIKWNSNNINFNLEKVKYTQEVELIKNIGN